MTIQIGQIQSKPNLMACWEDVCEIVEKQGGKWLEIVDLKEIFAMVVTGNIDLWLGTDGEKVEMVAFCCWEFHARAKFYHILWSGGSSMSKYLRDALQTFEQYACMAGANKVKIGGRVGWMKLLPQFGYHPDSVVMEKTPAMPPGSVN